MGIYIPEARRPCGCYRMQVISIYPHTRFTCGCGYSCEFDENCMPKNVFDPREFRYSDSRSPEWIVDCILAIAFVLWNWIRGLCRLHDASITEAALPEDMQPDWRQQIAEDPLTLAIHEAAIVAGLCEICGKDNRLECQCIGGNKAFLRLVDYTLSLYEAKDVMDRRPPPTGPCGIPDKFSNKEGGKGND